MKYCALLDPHWELRLEPTWGPFFFFLVFISLEAKWGNGRSYFILVDQAVCFGAAFYLHPSGTVLQPFNYSMPQSRSLESDKLMAVPGGWVLRTCRPLPSRSLSPELSGENMHTNLPHQELGAYAMTLKVSLLDSCSSSRSRRECWI